MTIMSKILLYIGVAIFTPIALVTLLLLLAIIIPFMMFLWAIGVPLRIKTRLPDGTHRVHYLRWFTITEHRWQ